MPIAPGWTQDEDDRLMALWRERNTFTEISRDFPGRTRNACIGRLTRLRKKWGTDMIPEGRSVKPAAAKKKRKRGKTNNFNIKVRETMLAEPTPIKQPPAPPSARRLPLLELGPKDCRFIVTETRPHLYCAVDASAYTDDYGNNCYCGFHQRVMRASVQPRR